MTRFGYRLMTQQSGPRELVRYAHQAEDAGWFGGGWSINADVPTPAAFAAASRYVTTDDVAGSIPCGPDLDELVESFRLFFDAGSTDIALVQIGDESQDEFLRTVAGPLLERQRAL